MLIAGDAVLNETTLNGNTIQVNGNLLVQDNVTLGVATTEEKGTLIVDGDLQLTAGMLHLNYGEITVGGNACFARINDDGSYSRISLSGELAMDNESDSFTIGGDLVTYFYGSSSSYYNCSSGVMNIGGNWTNYNYTSSATMSGSGDFAVIFKGTGALTINGNGALYVPSMTIENASSRSITMKGGVGAGILNGGDMTITAKNTPSLRFDTTTGSLDIQGDAQLSIATKADGDITVQQGNLQVNGIAMGSHVLNIDGNLTMDTSNKTLAFGTNGKLKVSGDVWQNKGNVSMGSSEAVIEGNYYQAAGELKIGSGNLQIRGDYRLQSLDESSGEISYTSSSGKLYMTEEAGKMVVGGDFYTYSTYSHKSYLTAGTLYVFGDFYEYTGNTNNFAASGTHTVVLCGTEPQTVTFQSSDSKFQILKLTQDIGQYTFNPTPCWNTLEENVILPDELKCFHGHTWDEGTITTAPTCMEDGIKTFTCTVCKETETEAVAALGHNYSSVVTEPSCTAQGYTTHTCSICGDSYTDTYVEMIPHNYNEGEQSALPNCTEEGVMTYTCITCGDTYIEAIAATGHNYEAVVTNPTCLEQGYTTHTCGVCEDSYIDSYTEPLGHKWDSGVITTEPTETEKGIRIYTCERCKETRTETIPELSSPEHTHSYITRVTEPTCTEQGYTTYICSCGDQYMASYVDALGHTWKYSSTSQYESCEEDGLAIYICSTCDESKEEVIPAYGHDYEYEEIDPTCTTYGYLLYTCQECDHSYRDELVNPMGHFYQNGVCRRCEEPEQELVASGICGDDLSWTLTAIEGEKGILTITGTGNMWDFTEACGDDVAPWYLEDIVVAIEMLIIEDGCTSIGDYAFSGNAANSYCWSDGLKTVILADTITKIGKYAFEYNEYLDTIRLPENLKTIDEAAFCETGLLDIYLPDSVKYLRCGAFSDCDDLLHVKLSKGLSAIEEDAFYDCGSLQRADLPESVIEIGNYAFAYTDLLKVFIPAGVTEIASNAYNGCTNLEAFYVDSENATYKAVEGVLYSIDGKELVRFPVGLHRLKVIIPEEVTKIGENAFAGTWIEQIDIPKGLYYIGNSAFYNCKNLLEIDIPDNVYIIGADAFKLCTSLSEIGIPAGVSQIGAGTFYGDSSLKMIQFKGDAPEFYLTSWNEPFGNVTATVYYPANNTTWTEDVMQDYGGTLIWVEMPEIANGYSGNLTWTLTADGTLTFSGSGAMKNYTYKSEMPWYAYMDQITAVVLEEGVTRIGNYAFYGMPNLESIEIPESVTIIGTYAFKNSTALNDIVLPGNLTKLGESAFYGCSALTSIEIPASLWTIQPYTFKNCTSLKNVIFNEGNLQKISDAAFYNTALTEVTLPDCLDILDVYVFKNCSNLKKIVLSNSLTQIREASLYGTGISNISIPEGVTKIGAYAFKNCAKLTSISLPTTLTSVGEASFYACTALKKMILPDAVTTIGNYAFRKCEKLASVTFADSLETIGESSFYGCTALTVLDIPENVTEIQGYAFKGCTGVTIVCLPDSLETLGESSFYGCIALSDIVIPVNVTMVGDYTFSRCSELEEVQFVGNAPSIGSGAFSKVTATIYYPTDNTTWTSDIMQNYGGTLSWKAN